VSEGSHPTKRRSERLPAQIKVTLVIEGNEAEQLASKIHLSQHGLGLQSDLSLARGQPVGFLLSDNPSCIIGARVVWVGKGDSVQAGQVGLEFLNPLARPA
jgi:hypothetical protein